MRSRRTHFRLLLAAVVACELLWAAGAAAGGEFHPWPATALVTDPAREGQALVPTIPFKVAAPGPGDTLISSDPTARFQEIEGYGAAITDSTLITIAQLPRRKQRKLLKILFDARSGLNISYVRVPIGATDFGLTAYSYADLPAGHSDPRLKRFSFRRARKLVAFLRQIKRINPSLRILLSPWSPPAWMKTSGSLNGGSLKPEFFPAYALYLAKTVRAFEWAGIKVDSLTIQNEPFFSTDKYPTMQMETPEQISFIRDHLTPLFARAGIRVKILGLDHNYDLRSEADALHAALGDKIAGIAYHCYGGTYEQMQGTPAPIYQTECSGGTWGDAAGAFHFWLQSQVIGAGLIGSRLSMGWNLALDQDHGPYLGYCGNCRGLVDIDTRTKKITFNPELVAMAHAGKFLARGAVRIASGPPADEGYSTIAYLNRDGSVVQVVENTGITQRAFVLASPRGDFYRVEVPAGGAATLHVSAQL